LVDALPPFAQEVVLYLPMVHGVELVREGYFGSQARAHYDLGYMIPITLALSCVALLTVRSVARRVVPE
jgi:ABC-2 type transport system permease protein/capsular polysaccharide transport system permease protein